MAAAVAEVNVVARVQGGHRNMATGVVQLQRRGRVSTFIVTTFTGGIDAGTGQLVKAFRQTSTRHTEVRDGWPGLAINAQQNAIAPN